MMWSNEAGPKMLPHGWFGHITAGYSVKRYGYDSEINPFVMRVVAKYRWSKDTRKSFCEEFFFPILETSRIKQFIAE